jgi:hypothetical protein
MLATVGRTVDRHAHRGDRRRPVMRLDHHLGAMAAAQPEQRRGAEHVGAVGVCGGLGDLAGGRAGRRRLLGRADDPDQVGERRVVECAPPGQLPRDEPARVVRGRRDDRGRIRRRRLDQHVPAARSAPSAAGELGDERERPLLGAEVREAQR